MEHFSKLDLQIKNFDEQVEAGKLNLLAEPFSKSEMSPESKSERLRKSYSDFWEFDKIYFSSEMYSDGLSKICQFQRDLAAADEQPGVSIFLGPRKHGKTVTMKKRFVWKLLTNKVSFAATLSSTLTTSRNILQDIAAIFNLPKIIFDFDIEIIEQNSEQITFRQRGTYGLRRVIALSEGRSARGSTIMFQRLQYILCDDLETRESPLGEEQVVARINIIKEAFQSLDHKGSLVILGNNFDERCALNRLLIEQNEGLLPKYWRVKVYQAWDSVNSKPLWKERYKAKSEAALKKLLKVSDDSEWLGDFQQEPTPPDGFIFQRLNPLPTWSVLPLDAKGVIYVDPNLSKKGKGDTTGIVSLLYSASTDKYYISSFACKSFSDSDLMLGRVFAMYQSKLHRALGFDGHVSQESTWSNNVRNFCRINDSPYPYIQYCRYHVDELTKNIRSVWNEGRILIPDNMLSTKEGKHALAQLFSFRGKKSNKKDDFPDALICAYELLHERRLVKRAGMKHVTITIQDIF
jgi:hypothetical protein